MKNFAWGQREAMKELIIKNNFPSFPISHCADIVSLISGPLTLIDIHFLWQHDGLITTGKSQFNK